MDEAARRAPPNHPMWIEAQTQTAARGRQGKTWKMAEGNFAATWLTVPTRPASEVALTSFVAAIALQDTLAHYVARDALSLKWPNDVLLNGGKVAGILLESSSNGQIMEWLAVGIGINLVSAPAPGDLPELALRPVSVGDAMGTDGVPPTSEAVLTRLANDMDRWMGVWSDQGFGPIRAQWLQGAARLGEQITVRLPHQTLEGRFETVDPDGCLVLHTRDGPRRIAAGDIHFN